MNHMHLTAYTQQQSQCALTSKQACSYFEMSLVKLTQKAIRLLKLRSMPFSKKIRICVLFYITLVGIYKLIEVVLTDRDLLDTLPQLEIKSKYDALPKCTNNASTSIDAVYTWVNGSDPLLLRSLQHTTNRLIIEKLSKHCFDPSQQCSLLPMMLIRPSLLSVNNYFGDVIKTELFNQTASLIYLRSTDSGINNLLNDVQQHLMVLIDMPLRKSSLEKFTVNSRAEGNNCVRLIGGQVYKLTNLCLNTDNQTDGTVTINSILKVANNAEHNNWTYADHLLRHNMHLLEIDTNYTLESRNYSLYTSKPQMSSMHKLAALLRSKLNSSTHFGEWEIQTSLSLRMTDVRFFRHQLKYEALEKNRFADNGELKYSLRSLEQYAPWIRHVYIVTNGQLPVWLNLEHAKVTVVTHQEIFPNSSHLPTFSSSAIESHLHRIPGLTQRFLYFNDDIILGKAIYPDDFYTESKGFKVYLSWPVPDCAPNCPLNWLMDGYCDKACNVSQCLWDGGDCVGVTSTNVTLANIELRFPESTLRKQDHLCAPNCLTAWLGDSFCDQVCNKPECAYDMADCGVAHFADDSFEEVLINESQSDYIYNHNSSIIYLNFSNYVHNESNGHKYRLQLHEAQHSNVSCIFIAVLNLRHQILIILLKPQVNREQLTFYLNASIKRQAFNFTINLIDQDTVNTSQWNVASVQQHNLKWTQLLPQANVTNLQGINTNYTNNTDTEMFVSVKQTPRVMNFTLPSNIVNCEVNTSALPASLRDQLIKIDKLISSGFMTEKGKSHFYLQMSQLYSQIICNQTWSTSFTKDQTINDLLVHWVTKQSYKSRRLLDAYADSLIYVNHLYNKVFGKNSRLVPAHMAHFIDRDIMNRLQELFASQFERTSSRPIRNSEDMQYSFSYFYFLMSETKHISLHEILQQFDTDHSRSLSLNELRTLLLQLHKKPITEVQQMYQKMWTELNLCCDQCLQVNVNFSEPYFWIREFSVEIPLQLLQNCTKVRNQIQSRWSVQKANKFQMVNDDEIAFKMLRSNESLLQTELDELRLKRKKFMCLNDNFDHGFNQSQEKRLRRILKQFYANLFPLRSQFELPEGISNRFLYIDQYRQWKAELNNKQQTYFHWSYLLLITTIILFACACI